MAVSKAKVSAFIAVLLDDSRLACQAGDVEKAGEIAAVAREWTDILRVLEGLK